ncbi:DUF1801 domain-containing protein [Flavobacterium cerinum]|uniref:DUF1801 domain-containing protein n=1 Tax=Flavobacterium cerinum TaxID=2502784 RepID=A0A3S3Q877_9FLAO|nr:DUF1801 domain-containing protein [Flavobacterium cerinum]RWW98930.1 DUF1801 domain-containing protein [Flavobacterium cerinum]
MIRPIDRYFLEKEPLVRDCMLFLRNHILNFDSGITEALKYGMPFYCYKDKMLCYLWTNKKTGEPYIGIVDGNKMDRPDLIAEKRSRMKIFQIDSAKDIPIQVIDAILTEMLQLR